MVTNCLNYKCLYYYKFKYHPLTFKDWVCFSEMYIKTRNMPENKKNYGEIGIKVYFSKDLNEKMTDNYCLLNDNELKEYFNWVKNITRFNVKESNEINIPDHLNNTDYKTFVVKFRGRYPYEIRLIAALIRNIYECPYNIMVKIACLMKTHKEFSNLDFTQRFCVAINTLFGFNDGHSIFNLTRVAYFNNKSLKERSFKNRSKFINVNNFIGEDSNLVTNRIHYKNSNYEDSSMFNDLEVGLINDELKEILKSNYEIMKENEK